MQSMGENTLKENKKYVKTGLYFKILMLLFQFNLYPVFCLKCIKQW